MQFAGGKNNVLLLVRRALGLVFYFNVKKKQLNSHIFKDFKTLSRSQIKYTSLEINKNSCKLA